MSTSRFCAYFGFINIVFAANVGVMAMYWQHAHAPKTADVSEELKRLRAHAKSAQEELDRRKDLTQQEREEINHQRIRAKKEQEEINRQQERTKKDHEEIGRLRIEVTNDQMEIVRQKDLATKVQEEIVRQQTVLKKEQEEINGQKALAKKEREEREQQLALAKKKLQDEIDRKKSVAKGDPSIPTPKKLDGDLLVILIETTELRRRSFDALAAQLTDFQENHVAKDLKRELLGGAIHVTRTKDCVPWSKDDAAGPAFANDAFHDAFQRAFADAEKLTAQAKNPAAVKAVLIWHSDHNPPDLAARALKMPDNVACLVWIDHQGSKTVNDLFLGRIITVQGGDGGGVPELSRSMTTWVNYYVKKLDRK